MRLRLYTVLRCDTVESNRRFERSLFDQTTSWPIRVPYGDGSFSSLPFVFFQVSLFAPPFLPRPFDMTVYLGVLHPEKIAENVFDLQPTKGTNSKRVRNAKV